jgi:ribosomal peptide maturation radical SAM protein 1
MGQRPRVALVVMPWAIPDTPPLGAAVLKSWLGRNGVDADVHHFYLRFHRWVGPLVDALSVQPQSRFAEWAFAYQLFGPGGTGELPFGFDEAWSRVFEGDMARFGRERLERLVERDIPSFLDHCESSVDWGRYDLIGFSSMFFNHPASLALAKRLKARHPRVPIAFGGANVEGPMGDATIKGCEWVDYVVDGEGELALLALARDLACGGRGEGIPRLSRREGDRVVLRDAAARPEPIAMSRVPPPDHDDYFRELAACGLEGSILPRVTFEGSRGCWWGQKQHCTFCGLNGQAMTYRSKDPETVAAEVMELHRRHKAFKLQACDNILGHDHVRTLLPALRRAREDTGADWQLFFEIKANLGAADLEALAAAGVTIIQPGIDSLSTPVLKRMRKGVTAIQNVAALKEASGRVHVMWGIIWGFAGEDPEDYRRMAELLPSLTHLPPATYQDPIRVDRFSPLHFDWERLGTLEPVPASYYRYTYPQPRFDLKEIAYFFESRWPAGSPDPAAYAEALITPAVKHWQSVYARNYFAHRSGDGFLELYDSRPLRPGVAMEQRVDRLEGVDAAAYEACSAPRSLDAVARACAERDPSFTREAVTASLARMESRRWLMREGDLFLSLSVPVSRLPAEQRVALNRMSAAALLREMTRIRPAPAQAAASSSK